jgi:hypothetical protein
VRQWSVTGYIRQSKICASLISGAANSLRIAPGGRTGHRGRSDHYRNRHSLQPRDIRRNAQTNSRGEFRIDDLAPGNYTIVVRAAGFAEAHADARIIVSFVRDVMVTLRPASVKESVNVRGEGSSVTTQPFDTTRTVQQGIVTSQDLRDVPLAARSFANIAYMAPGTEPVEPSDPTKARITAVSFGGSSGLNVQLSVDGGDNTDDYIGGFLQRLRSRYSDEELWIRLPCRV